MTLADGHYLDDLRSLRDRQDQLRAAFEAVSDAMIIADDDGRWLELNAATSTLLGGPTEQLRGRHLRDFLSSPVVPLMDGAPAAGLAPGTREFEVMRADGSTRVVEYRATPNILPGRHLSILRDVTDDREAEAERTQLAAIVDAVEDAIIGHTLDGRITTWNPAAARIYGIPRADAVGGHLSRLVPPEGQAELEKLLTIVASGQAVGRRDAVHCGAGGNPVEISMSLAPVRNGRGRVVGGAIVAREIGDGRDLERSLRHAASPATGTETLLLLEDDAAVRVLTQSVLQRSGYTVLAAADPGEALTLALEHRGDIDLLVTDLRLPGMSGRQLAQQLAAIGCAERVLYTSSAALIGDECGDTAELEIDLLPKPFTADGLARRVRASLDRPPR